MKRAASSSVLALSGAVGFLLVGPARAAEGVREINQVCATTSGCFVGDPAGFPVNLVRSGSYRLTSDLVVPDANTSALLVVADDVTIDLAGFTISGPTTCTGTPIICAPVGSGRGVDIDVQNPPNRQTVRNGIVRGFGNRGVVAGASATIEGIRAVENGVLGIDAGSRSHIRGCEASQNGTWGLVVSSGSIAAENIASFNGSAGIVATNSLVTHNVASSNGFAGIQAASGGSLIGNVASGNLGDGILVPGGYVTLDGNTTSENAKLLAPSNEDGVQCDGICHVRDHAASGNDGLGLRLGAGSTYARSVMTGNSAGGVAGGTNAAGNYCAGPGVVSASCP